MFPSFKILNSAHRRSADIVLVHKCSHFSTFRKGFTYLQNLFFCKYSSGVVFPGVIPPSVFVDHIFYIGRLCPQKQMFWVATRGIVALMQYTQSVVRIFYFRYMAVIKHPAQFMRSIFRTMSSKYAISPFFTFCTFQIPAVSGASYGNLIPKSTYKRAVLIIRVYWCKNGIAQLALSIFKYVWLFHSFFLYFIRGYQEFCCLSNRNYNRLVAHDRL